MGQHHGTSLSPARVVLQGTLSSTCGHPLSHSATYRIAFVPSISLCLLPTCNTATGTPAHTIYRCVDSTKTHHLNLSHGVQIVGMDEGRFSSALLTTMSRIMHLLNNQSCMRCSNFQFLFLVYLPLFKWYSIKRKYCSKEGFNYNYLFIVLARVHKTAICALMLIKYLDTSPNTLVLFQSKWVGIKEISLGLYFYRSEQDYFNLNNYIVDIVAKLHNPEKNILFDPVWDVWFTFHGIRPFTNNSSGFQNEVLKEKCCFILIISEQKASIFPIFSL